MRYFEYTYLAVSIGLIVFLTFWYDEMENSNRLALIIGIVISSFMFSFRRQQRRKLEEAERREIEQLEEEVNDDGA